MEVESVVGGRNGPEKAELIAADRRVLKIHDVAESEPRKDSLFMTTSQRDASRVYIYIRDVGIMQAAALRPVNVTICIVRGH